MASIKELKRTRVRKSIPFNNGNTVEMLEVYNLSAEEQDELFEIVKNNINVAETEIDIKDHSIIESVYKKLTNIEFDTVEELIEVLSDPNHELMLIGQEVSVTIMEIVKLKLQERYITLEGMEVMGVANEAMKKATELEKAYLAVEEVITNAKKDI